MKPIPYSAESPFWYFLARQALAKAEKSLPMIFERLNERAEIAGIPVRYEMPHSLARSVLCQLFQVTRPFASQVGRFAFTQMRLGFGHALGPKGFVDVGLKRILGNIGDPAFADRRSDQSVADTFLVNGGRLVDPRSIPESLDYLLQERLLRDTVLLDLGRRAIEPPPELLSVTIDEYARRRPNWLRRTFANPDKWLFGTAV